MDALFPNGQFIVELGINRSKVVPCFRSNGLERSCELASRKDRLFFSKYINGYYLILYTGLILGDNGLRMVANSIAFADEEDAMIFKLAHA